MNDRTFETLELRDFLILAARHVQTPSGRKRMLELRPSTSRSGILQELEMVSECVVFLANNGKFGLSGIADPAPIMKLLQIEGTSLEPNQILALEKLLSTCRHVQILLSSPEPEDAYPHLRRIAGQLPDTRRLLSVIAGKILPNGELDDGASPELRLVRKELTDRRTRIHRTLEGILRNSSQAVQEEIITFRNDRFVIPVRTDSRNQIPGVVHGLSSSGQTTFIEPLTIIEQNNDLVRLHEREAVEIARILLEISDCLRNSLEDIQTTVEILTTLDVSQAKALLATEFDCVPPAISAENIYELREARNILLENSLRKTGGTSVPISVELSADQCALILSGPNAGGKTVALKTLGLTSLMTQMGFLIPAKQACLPVFNQVFADIGDQQSMAANLSTFTAHMRNIAEMDSHLQPPSLVLLDEVGTGTDPDEGSALAIAIIDHFRNEGAIVAASTHYPRLKMWASQTEGIQNASVEFDENTLQPTYRLVIGTAGASSGIEIARRMKIHAEILSKAASLVDPAYAEVQTYLRQLKEILDEQETLRAALDSERAAVAGKYSALEKEFEDREKNRVEEYKSKMDIITHDFKLECDRALRRINDRIESSRLRKAIAGEAAVLGRKSLQRIGEAVPGREEAQPTRQERNEVIHQGDRVHILSLDREGTAEDIADDSIVVSIGALRYRAHPSDLTKTDSPGTRDDPQSASNAITVDTAGEEADRELNVIGMNADDAIANVDKFLDRCFLAGTEKIRIIHGHGKGILKRAVANMLREHPQVEQFGPAPSEQGGSGATIVELKK